MIRVENLEKYYDRHKKNEKHVLQKINLELVDIHVISKHSGNGIYNGQNAVFF